MVHFISDIHFIAVMSFCFFKLHSNLRIFCLSKIVIEVSFSF